jgi:predicted Zn-dependent peptidase
MDIIKRKYENGLRSLSVLTQDTQAVTIMFLVKAGARDELTHERGLAHFVEHTIFKGTEKRPTSKQIGMEIESLGGSSNAFTSYEYTGYYIKTPSINFAQSFDVLADIFKNSIFAPEEVEKERSVIIEEIRMYEDRPTSKVAQEWQRNFFVDNSLGEEITGSIEQVSSIQREQFFEFLKNHYYGENTLVVVAGNVEQQQVEDMIRQYCLDLPSRTPDKQSGFSEFNFSPDKRREKQISLNKQVEQSHLMLGGLAVDRSDPERFAFQVANTILGNGFGSRLFQVIRDELALAYYVYSRATSFEDTGIFQIGLGVTPGREGEALSAVKAQLKAITDGNFTKEELVRAKNFLLGNLVTDLETSEDVATFYGMQELLQEEKLTIEQIKERIMDVGLEDINSVSTKYFTEENYFEAILSRAD